MIDAVTGFRWKWRVEGQEVDDNTRSGSDGEDRNQLPAAVGARQVEQISTTRQYSTTELSCLSKEQLGVSEETIDWEAGARLDPQASFVSALPRWSKTASVA